MPRADRERSRQPVVAHEAWVKRGFPLSYNCACQVSSLRHTPCGIRTHVLGSKGQDDYLSGVRPLHQGSEHRVFDRPVSLKLAVKTVRRLRLGAVRCTIRGPRLEQGNGPYQEPLCPYGCDPVHIHVGFYSALPRSAETTAIFSP